MGNVLPVQVPSIKGAYRIDLEEEEGWLSIVLEGLPRTARGTNLSVDVSFRVFLNKTRNDRHADRAPDAPIAMDRYM